MKSTNELQEFLPPSQQSNQVPMSRAEKWSHDVVSCCETQKVGVKHISSSLAFASLRSAAPSPWTFGSDGQSLATEPVLLEEQSPVVLGDAGNQRRNN